MKPTALQKTTKVNRLRKKGKETESTTYTKITRAAPAQPQPWAELPAGAQKRGRSLTVLPDLPGPSTAGAVSGSPGQGQAVNGLKNDTKRKVDISIYMQPGKRSPHSGRLALEKYLKIPLMQENVLCM